PWLKDFKQSEFYKLRPCSVNLEHEGVVGKIVQIVNSYWKQLNLGTELSLKAFEDLCFYEYTFTDHQIKVLGKIRKEWSGNHQRAKNWKESHGGSMDQIKNNNAILRNKKSEILRIINPRTKKVYNPYSWYRAAWVLSHTTDFKEKDSEKEQGRGQFAFTLFGREIVEDLKRSKDKAPSLQRSFYIWDTHKFDCCPVGKWWNGELVTCRIVWKLNEKGNYTQAMEMIDRTETRTDPQFDYRKTFKMLGWISDGTVQAKTPIYPQGTTFQARIYAEFGADLENGQATHIYLFPANIFNNKDFLWYFIGYCGVSSNTGYKANGSYLKDTTFGYRFRLIRS
ncbi:MAG TPA: hypothetical protein V6C58_09530, partial [Allocoleopsis sp.]